MVPDFYDSFDSFTMEFQDSYGFSNQQIIKGIVYADGSSGKFRNNLTSGTPTQFIGGADAGSNN